MRFRYLRRDSTPFLRSVVSVSDRLFEMRMLAALRELSGYFALDKDTHCKIASRHGGVTTSWKSSVVGGAYYSYIEELFIRRGLIALGALARQHGLIRCGDL